MLLGIRKRQTVKGLGDWYSDLIGAGDISSSDTIDYSQYDQSQNTDTGATLTPSQYLFPGKSAEQIAAEEADKTAFTPSEIAAVKTAMSQPTTLTAAQAVASGIDLVNRTLVNYNGAAYKYMPQTQQNGSVLYVPQRIGTLQNGQIIASGINPIMLGAAAIAAFLLLS